MCDEKNQIILESMDFPEPVVAVSVEPVSKGDQDSLSIGLQKLGEEDPTFKVETNEETGQTIISGMGELHLEILIDRLEGSFLSRQTLVNQWLHTAKLLPRGLKM